MANLNSGLFLIALALWGAIFLSLAIGLIWLIWEMIWMGVPEATRATWDFRFALARLAGMTATLGAVVALPFTLVRVRLSGEQTRTAQEGLITDRINKAVEGLGADKVVKRQRVRESGKLAYVNVDGEADLSQPIMEEVTEPNLEVRIGSIYALERIAQDSDRDHVNVMKILCAYIQQNSPVKAATPIKVKNENIFIMDSRLPELPAPRADIQTAINVLKRRNEKQLLAEKHAAYNLDLQRCNL